MKQSLIIIMIFSLILFIHKPTNAQDAGTAKLLENVGSETVWKCRSSAVKIISGNSGLYSNLIRVGMGILAIAALLQIINKTIQHFGSGQINSERPYMYIFEWLISLLLFAFLCSGPVYGVLVRDVIAGIPDLISQLILDSFYEEMYSSLVDLFKSEKEGILSSSWHFLTMTISGGTTQAIMSGVMYLITKTLLFIFPMVQKMVFAVVVIMGPICLPFGMCDWTRRIAFSWLGMALTVSMWGIVGSSSFWAWHTFEIQKYLIIGNTSNFFLAVAFGIGSIILFLSSFMISGSIFSGLSSVGILTSGALISSMANSVYKANGMLSNGSSEKSGSSDNLGSGFSSKKSGKVSESDTGGTLVSNTPGNIG
jgi:hypothetical protein